jgi:hypothetical protein
MDWEAAIRRTGTLAERHKGAGELLHFYRALLRFQMDVYHRAKAAARADAQRLDTRMLAGFFPDFLQLVEKYGPRDLAAQAQKLEDRQDWEFLLKQCWQQGHDRLEILGRAILQPYVQYLAERWHVEVGSLGEGGASCPFCSRAPQMAVQNGRRLLVCSLCSHEWAFGEKQCPGCRSEKLEPLRHRSYPQLRADACRGCGHYFKVLDLRRDPEAVAVVDEVASVELDELARTEGYTKLEPNIIGR